MSFNPLRAVGMVLGQLDEGNDVAFLGSCFALRDCNSLITAAHCIGDLPADRLFARIPHNAVIIGDPPQAFSVVDVIRHPTADVAILRIDIARWRIEPFWNVVEVGGLGAEFMAYGLPESVRAESREPTARLFKGYVQRAYWHESHMSYRYSAFELDFACPAGLSGGPLFREGAQQMVLGVATENIESTTFLDAVEETMRDGSKVTTQYQRVLSYGVAVNLAALNDWLDEHLPAFDSGAWLAREQARQRGEDPVEPYTPKP